MFKELAEELQTAKKLVKMSEQQLLMLKKLNKEISDEDKVVKSMFISSEVSESSCQSWEERIRLDALQIKQRGSSCKDIKDKVFKLIKTATQNLKYKEERYGDIKGLPRTLVKLQE